MMATYPTNWEDIANRIKDNAGWKCERCKHPHEVETRHVLTVHHLDGNKGNCADWNLAALCQRCHLAIQGRVKMDQLFFVEILSVSEWFKPHWEGFLQTRSVPLPQKKFPPRRRGSKTLTLTPARQKSNKRKEVNHETGPMANLKGAAVRPARTL